MVVVVGGIVGGGDVVDVEVNVDVVLGLTPVVDVGGRRAAVGGGDVPHAPAVAAGVAAAATRTQVIGRCVTTAIMTFRAAAVRRVSELVPGLGFAKDTS